MTITADELAEIERAALLGTRRRALPVPAALKSFVADVPPDRRSLALIAMAAQRRRLGAHPADPGDIEVIGAAPEDDRPWMPQAARASFRRFLEVEASSTDLHFTGALAMTLSLAGLRVHPHDLFEALKADDLAETFGPFESWWIRQAKPRGVKAAVALDPETWTELRPASLRESIRAWRARDPAAARLFVEQVFSDGSAEQRTILVEGFETEICGEDAPFLERAAGDSSKNVRAAAEKAAACVPGSPWYAETVARYASAMRAGKNALLSRKNLTFELIAQAPTSGVYTRVRLSDLAAAVKLTPEDLVAKADTQHVPTNVLLLSCALAENRDDLIETLLVEAGDNARACLGGVNPLPNTLPLPVRRRLIAPLLRPSAYRAPPANPSESALTLFRALRGPLDAEAIRMATASEGFRQCCDLLLERADFARTWAPRAEIIGIAALSPPEAAEHMIETLDPLSDHAALGPAFSYLRFLADLARAGVRLSDDSRA